MKWCQKIVQYVKIALLQETHGSDSGCAFIVDTLVVAMDQKINMQQNILRILVMRSSDHLLLVEHSLGAMLMSSTCSW